MALPNLMLPHQVLESLKDDEAAQGRCLVALVDLQNGETKASKGDSRGAIANFHKAEAVFREIPKARALLCNIYNKLAAEYGKLGNQQKCRDYAEDALSIAERVPELAYAEASARMNLGTAAWILGDQHRGRMHYDKAREILRRLPGRQEDLAALDHNEQNLTKRHSTFATSTTAPGLLSSLAAFALALLFLYVVIRSCS